jgi:hypothetical protein
MSQKTLETHSIPIPPQLTGLLKQALGKSGTGFDEGAFLQQLHYWTLNSQTTGWLIDETKWIYNSLKAWQLQFPWISEYGLRKAIANLKKLGLIETAQHWISQYKRVMFYRIDYDRLNAFTGDSCEYITPPCVSSDRIEVSTDRISYSETSSNTSFSEQQTVVVLEVESLEVDDSLEDQSDLAGSECDLECDLECDRVSELNLNDSELDPFPPDSSGNKLETQHPEFPELQDAVVEAIASPPDTPLPNSLKQAIIQFPERVKEAIAYLQYQQQKRQIQNPIGYLYEAIVSGWNLSIARPISISMLPEGFNEWFDEMKRQGQVAAAMTIDGVHHTLHNQQGWVPTEQLMRSFPMPVPSRH